MPGTRYLSRTANDDAFREWEVYRYFRPLQKLLGTPGYPSKPAITSEGLSTSHDHALTAFAQLGALRLNTRRGIISLLDRSHQYVVAEATKTLSLQDGQIRDEEDGLWLGMTSIPRVKSPCGYAAGLLVPSEIETRDSSTGEGSSDVAIFPELMNHPEFRDLPFVQSKPYHRFYAGVPLISPDGFNIGVYCVIDDKPRDGLTSSDVEFLKNMAKTVMSHLVMVRAKDELGRSQKMVQGLSNFVHGDPNVTSDMVENRERRVPSTEPSFDATQSEDNSPNGPGISYIRSDPSPCKQMPESSSPTPKNRSSYRRSTEDTKEPSVMRTSSGMRSTFQRAAIIVRDVTDLDGVLILDASVAKYTLTDPTRDRKMSVSSSPAASSSLNESPRSRIDNSGDEYPCVVLGSSTRKKSDSSALPDVPDPHLVSEVFLQSLLRKYPAGKIWTHDPIADKFFERIQSIALDELPRTNPAIEDWLERRALRELFPDFRSIAFAGMRHNTTSRWFAASIIWTCSPTRVLSPNSELVYLVAFNQSIMAELAKQDVRISNQAKTTFISSISHDLRTPLHGIMGSLECLQGINPDSAQNQLLNTIETCSQTLLDMFDNLLSFASTEQFMDGERRRSTGSNSSPRTKGSKTVAPPSNDVDLRVLTEAVIDTILAGRRFGQAYQNVRGASLDNTDGPLDGALDPLKSPDVNLVLEFDDHGDSTWKFHTQAGGWRRLILNLVGNSLKYTDEGRIEVRVSSCPLPKVNGEEKSQVTLTVADTGRGMSPEFLQSQLFSPFVQEDPLSPGTGLGLSICKQLTQSMGGEITVTSEKTKGSEFRISIVLSHALSSTEREARPSARDNVSGKIAENHLMISTIQVPHISQSTETTHDLGALFVKQCSEWLDITATMDHGSQDKDFYIASEKQAWSLKMRLSKPLLVVRNIVSACGSNLSNHLAALTPHSEYLTQPWTSQKLAEAIAACMEKAHVSPSWVSDATTATASDGMERSDIEGGEVHSQEAETSQVIGRTPILAKQVTVTTVVAAAETIDITPPSSVTSMLSEPPASPSPLNSDHPNQQDVSAISVLLVDDNSINLQLLATFMKKKDHAYSTAVNGLDALTQYQTSTKFDSKRSYSYILLDINMPVMDGIECLRRIREFEVEKGLRKCCVVILTGGADEEVRKDAFAAGADMFLNKPVKLAQLGKILSDVAS